MTIEPQTFVFDSDGSVPNNPALPVLLYRGGIDVSAGRDPERAVEQIFIANGWGRDIWRNGIYSFAHFHSMIHEVLGIARGSVRVRLGGRAGQEFVLETGDVAVLPAGTGHQRLSEHDGLSVVGGYPPQGRYDVCRGGASDVASAVQAVAQVPLPSVDPLFGDGGPLLTHWCGKP